MTQVFPNKLFRDLCLSAAAMIATMVVATPNAPAQAEVASAKAPAFDVASIREIKNSDGSWKMEFTQDGLTARNVPLKYVIKDAYGIYDDSRWSGGPAWLDSIKFSIEAKFDGTEYKDLTIEQRRAMLQALLADRFKVVVHHEMKEFPIFALVVAKNGPKLRETKPGDGSYSGIYNSQCLHTRAGRGFFEAEGCTMKELASDLATSFAGAELGRMVVDRTNLTGRYNYALHWTSESAATSAASDPSGPSIFSALPQQLGLKLESTKGPLDTIVIDHAEMPSEN